MKKKLILMLLSLAALFNLTACGNVKTVSGAARSKNFILSTSADAWLDAIRKQSLNAEIYEAGKEAMTATVASYLRDADMSEAEKAELSGAVSDGWYLLDSQSYCLAATSYMMPDESNASQLYDRFCDHFKKNLIFVELEKAEGRNCSYTRIKVFDDTSYKYIIRSDKTVFLVETNEFTPEITKRVAAFLSDVGFVPPKK